MNWKFWQKKPETQTAAEGSASRLPKPKDLPQELGRHLVVTLGHDPDWVWSLRYVAMPRNSEKPKGLCDIRLFNPEEAQHAGVFVRDYKSLDAHPQMVLFEGWFDRSTRQLQIEFLRKAG